MATLDEMRAINAEFTVRQRCGPLRLRLTWWLRDRGWYRPIIWMDRVFGPDPWP